MAVTGWHLWEALFYKAFLWLQCQGSSCTDGRREGKLCYLACKILRGVLIWITKRGKFCMNGMGLCLPELKTVGELKGKALFDWSSLIIKYASSMASLRFSRVVGILESLFCGRGWVRLPAVWYQERERWMWDRAVRREDRSTQKRLMGSCAETAGWGWCCWRWLRLQILWQGSHNAWILDWTKLLVEHPPLPPECQHIQPHQPQEQLIFNPKSWSRKLNCPQLTPPSTLPTLCKAALCQELSSAGSGVKRWWMRAGMPSMLQHSCFQQSTTAPGRSCGFSVPSGETLGLTMASNIIELSYGSMQSSVRCLGWGWWVPGGLSWAVGLCWVCAYVTPGVRECCRASPHWGLPVCCLKSCWERDFQEPKRLKAAHIPLTVGLCLSLKGSVGLSWDL